MVSSAVAAAATASPWRALPAPSPRRAVAATARRKAASTSVVARAWTATPAATAATPGVRLGRPVELALEVDLELILGSALAAGLGAGAGKERLLGLGALELLALEGLRRALVRLARRQPAAQVQLLARLLRQVRLVRHLLRAFGLGAITLAVGLGFAVVRRGAFVGGGSFAAALLLLFFGYGVACFLVGQLGFAGLRAPGLVGRLLVVVAAPMVSADP